MDTAKHKLKKIDLFIIISLSCTLAFILVLIGSKGDAAEWLVMEHYFDGFLTDHFRHICFASDMTHFYFNTDEAPFPPFAYLFYRLFVMINPPEQPWGILDWDAVTAYRYNMLILIMFLIIIVLIFEFMVRKYLPKEGTGRITLFMISLLLSAPFMWGCIERGNVIFLVAVMLLTALYLKDIDNAVCREAALLLIAAAAGFKLYPAVAGFIYVKEKRWKEGIRLLIYGLIVFFVPFAFVGGVPAFKRYLQIILFFETSSYCNWTNIRDFLLSISRILGQYEKSASFVIYFKIIENLYLLLCLLSLFKTREKWKYSLYTAGIMSLYVSHSFRYVSCYMMIPLVMYLRQDPEKQKMIYCVLFALTFTTPFYGYFTDLEPEFFMFLPIYLIMAYSFVEEWIYPLIRKRPVQISAPPVQ